MLARSAKALFSGLIDYAGLFPPAALPMADAVRKYDAYRRGEHAWMLGRFVVPVAKIGEVPDDFPIAFVAPLIEVTDNIYVESDDIDTLAARGLRAKIRTGGVTADAFPAAASIATFIQRCAERGVPFKATAGLHHPIRCIKPLTYEPDAPTGTMHGFVNLFMAAALASAAVIPSVVEGPGSGGWRDDRAATRPDLSATLEMTLMETDARAFEFGDDAASWRGHSVTTEDLARIRSEFAISFGSCSFEEPVADLKELGWL